MTVAVAAWGTGSTLRLDPEPCLVGECAVRALDGVVGGQTAVVAHGTQLLVNTSGRLGTVAAHGTGASDRGQTWSMKTHIRLN